MIVGSEKQRLQIEFSAKVPSVEMKSDESESVLVVFGCLRLVISIGQLSALVANVASQRLLSGPGPLVRLGFFGPDHPDFGPKANRC